MAVDSEDMWADMLAIYMCFTLGERISLDNGPALDTGGVRRQVYTCVYNKFITNECMHLFEGPEIMCDPSTVQNQGNQICSKRLV